MPLFCRRCRNRVCSPDLWQTKAPESEESGAKYGASDLTRTGDLLITSEMHYRLCYTSITGSLLIIAENPVIVNPFLELDS